VRRVARMSSSTFSWQRICSAGTCAMAKPFIIATVCGTTIVARTSSSGRVRSHQTSVPATPLNGRPILEEYDGVGAPSNDPHDLA
jgi:hypothetical protein